MYFIHANLSNTFVKCKIFAKPSPAFSTRWSPQWSIALPRVNLDQSQEPLDDSTTTIATFEGCSNYFYLSFYFF